MSVENLLMLGGRKAITGSVTSDRESLAIYNGDDITYTFSSDDGEGRTVYWTILTTGTTDLTSGRNGSGVVTDGKLVIKRTIRYNKPSTGTIQFVVAKDQISLTTKDYIASSTIRPVLANPSGSITLTSSSGNWIAPAGVRYVSVAEIDAAGGGGGVGAKQISGTGSANGGPGGIGQRMRITNQTVVPGNSYPYACGAPGKGAVYSVSASTRGGNSTMFGRTAQGGYGGGNGVSYPTKQNGAPGANGGSPTGDSTGGAGGAATQSYQTGDPLPGKDGLPGKIALTW